MNGGNLNPAIRAPLIAPHPRPATNPAGMPIRPQFGSFEAMTATIALLLGCCRERHLGSRLGNETPAFFGHVVAMDESSEVGAE